MKKLVLVLLTTVASTGYADWGVDSIRVQCSENFVLFEPFLAWNDGNSPYSEFSGKIANEHPFVTPKEGQFYALEPGDISGECASEARKIKFTATRPAGEWLLTVIEDGKIVVDHRSFEKAFASNFDLTVESELKGKWKFCESEIIDQVASPKTCKMTPSNNLGKR